MLMWKLVQAQVHQSCCGHPFIRAWTDGHSPVTVTELSLLRHAALVVPIATMTAMSPSTDRPREACPSSNAVSEAQLQA